jgi:TRAP-type mannitol/chloroaromatic compound transport system permease small subunit
MQQYSSQPEELYLGSHTNQSAGKQVAIKDEALNMESPQPPSNAKWQKITLDVFGVFLLLLIGLIAIQVAVSFLGFNHIITFETEKFLVGKSINQNTIVDFQWLVLAIISLLPAALVWSLDKHVRVDFLWNKFSTRRKNLIELIGHVIFTAPFLFLSLPASWKFVSRSLTSNEMTSHGGMTDLYIAKATLPIGLGLLSLVLLIDIWRIVKSLLKN